MLCPDGSQTKRAFFCNMIISGYVSAFVLVTKICHFFKVFPAIKSSNRQSLWFEYVLWTKNGNWDFFSNILFHIPYSEPSFYYHLCHQIFWHTANRIRDRSIFSSMKPKFHNKFFIDSIALYKSQTWNCFCFDFCINGRTIIASHLV